LAFVLSSFVAKSVQVFSEVEAVGTNLVLTSFVTN